MKKQFKLIAPYKPDGDQPGAIASIVEAFQQGKKQHVLLGVTGSGKTFTMAHVIATLQKPTLIVAPNKTLAAQLYTEFKSLFPEDHVGLFMSYYDYYQPEAYLPSSDTYIAKDSAVNEDIDKMRHESTRYLMEEPNTIIVASVSCIYGLGSPSSYAKMMFALKAPMAIEREELLRRLIEIQYSRNDRALERGFFRVRGDVIDILPAHEKEYGIRVRFFGDEIDSLHKLRVADGKEVHAISEVCLFPNSHYITPRSDRKEIAQEILHDLGIRLRELHALRTF
jgi:excinuclease ABC subunit B